MSNAKQLEARYVAQWEKERAKVRRVGHLCTAATLVIIGTLFFYLIYLESLSTQLIALSFFVILTNFSRFIVYRLYLVPRFFLELRSDDATRREAAWNVVDAHRMTMLKPIVVERREPSKDEEIARIDRETVASWDDLDKIAWWERFSRIWIGIWCAALLSIIALLMNQLRALGG